MDSHYKGKEASASVSFWCFDALFRSFVSVSWCYVLVFQCLVLLFQCLLFAVLLFSNAKHMSYLYHNVAWSIMCIIWGFDYKLSKLTNFNLFDTIPKNNSHMKWRNKKIPDTCDQTVRLNFLLAVWCQKSAIIIFFRDKKSSIDEALHNKQGNKTWICVTCSICLVKGEVWCFLRFLLKILPLKSLPCNSCEVHNLSICVLLPVFVEFLL